ncbi:MAG: thiamine-phosphate pyrophosphorylase [Thermobacillus sp. ZCTH02-B1]|uniref:thiamine phosphate synthase n=1 Tax=Thermobacillus sp. ZCTH02-B1 TaxID=1858795 RepID=UPI000B57C4F4|nr:MAG: thiamine-phosphate pyrophosphorylase [Thermobacillus sp. ZCTH02-B1]
MRRAGFDFRLYAITGEPYHPGRDLIDVMEAAIRGGADVVQLRDKETPPSRLLEKARALRELTRRYGVVFIVNDDPELALEAEADGVHLGQEDMPIAEARRLLGEDKIIGISTHDIFQAREAVRQGADYIGVGPVYPTPTKPGRPAVGLEFVRQAAREIAIPWVAIGGITLDNADEVLDAGARRLCAVSAIVGSPDPEAASREFRRRIEAREAGRAEADGGAGRRADAGEAARSAGGPIPIRLNGRETKTTARTLMELIERHGLADRRIVAEVDGEIVARAEWGRTPLKAGAVVELVHFKGGG